MYKAPPIYKMITAAQRYWNGTRMSLPLADEAMLFVRSTLLSSHNLWLQNITHVKDLQTQTEEEHKDFNLFDSTMYFSWQHETTHGPNSRTQIWVLRDCWGQSLSSCSTSPDLVLHFMNSAFWKDWIMRSVIYFACSTNELC